MIKGRWIAGLLAAICLAGCHIPAVDSAAGETAQKIFDDIRHSDDAALQRLLAPALKTPDAAVQIAKLRSYIPAGEPRSRKTVSWNSFQSAQNGTVLQIADEYDFGDRIVLAQSQLHQPPGARQWLVEGFHVQTATLRELSVNRLSLANKSPWQLIFLASVIISPILMLAALVKVIRTRDLKRKWLWWIASFFGVTTLQMNWATGHLATNVLTVQLIGAGMVKGPSQFSPWLLTVTLPIGALLILTRVWANPEKSAETRRLKKMAETF